MARPTAMQRSIKPAWKPLAIPVVTQPSIKSITPFTNGTPGIRYKTPVAKAFSGTSPNPKYTLKEHIKHVTKDAKIMAIIRLNFFFTISCLTKSPRKEPTKEKEASIQFPPAKIQSEAHAKATNIKV